MKEKKIDTAVLSVLVLGLAFSSFQFFKNFSYSNLFRTENSLGIIKSIENDVQLKPSGKLVWVKGQRSNFLNNGDEVLTKNKSSAVLEMFNGIKIELEENTLFRVTKENEEVQLDVISGNIKVVDFLKSHKVKIKSPEKVIPQPIKTPTIIAEEIQTPAEIVQRQFQIQILTPVDDQTIEFTGAELNIGVSWFSPDQQKNKQFILELAEDEQFVLSTSRMTITNGTNTNLKIQRPGTYYLKVHQMNDGVVQGTSETIKVSVIRKAPGKPEVKNLKIKYKIIPAPIGTPSAWWKNLLFISEAVANDQFIYQYTIDWDASEVAKAYNISIYSDPELKNLVYETTTTQPGFNWSSPSPAQYYLVYSIQDEFGLWSEESEPALFEITTSNELDPLAEVQLISPKNKEKILNYQKDEIINFKWKEIKHVKDYIVQISHELDFKKTIFEGSSKNGNLKVKHSSLGPNKNYFWRVVANGKYSPMSVSQSRSFSIENEVKKSHIQLAKEAYNNKNYTQANYHLFEDVNENGERAQNLSLLWRTHYRQNDLLKSREYLKKFISLSSKLKPLEVAQNTKEAKEILNTRVNDPVPRKQKKLFSNLGLIEKRILTKKDEYPEVDPNNIQEQTQKNIFIAQFEPTLSTIYEYYINRYMIDLLYGQLTYDFKTQRSVNQLSFSGAIPNYMLVRAIKNQNSWFAQFQVSKFSSDFNPNQLGLEKVAQLSLDPLIGKNFYFTKQRVLLRVGGGVKYSKNDVVTINQTGAPTSVSENLVEPLLHIKVNPFFTNFGTSVGTNITFKDEINYDFFLTFDYHFAKRFVALFEYHNKTSNYEIDSNQLAIKNNEFLLGLKILF